MTVPNKLLVIGVDAGSPSLFRQWAASGDMPNMARLLREGVSGRVENPYALEAGAVWPVFHSGLLPGHQPQYDGRRVFDSAAYTHRWYEQEETPPPFWRQLSDQKLRCLLIDPPYVRLDRQINGTMIVDWGGHVPANGQAFELQTHPASVAREVLDLVGPDPADGVSCDRMSPESIDDYRRFIRTYRQRIERKTKLARHMLTTREWDLAMVVSSDLHCTGHHLWHISDPSHPSHSPALAAEFGEPLREFYTAFDRSLGEILEVVDSDTTVLLFGSHGMGPQYSGTGLLDRILLRLDQGRPAARPKSIRGTLRSLWHRVPLGIRTRLRALRKPFQGVLHTPRFLGNYDKRRFFEVYANNASGGIRINLQGREANGRVHPDEYDAVVASLQEQLSRVINMESGEPLVEDVIITRAHYDGDYVDRLPDLLVRWNRSAPIRTVRSEAIGVLTQETVDNRTGDHTPDGIYILHGAGVEQGGPGQDVQTADFAPAIARHFGLELERTDGEPFDLRSRAFDAA